MYIIDRRIIHFKLQHTNIENLLTSPINFVRSTRTVAIHKVPVVQSSQSSRRLLHINTLIPMILRGMEALYLIP